ncbi:outer membrane beta-barrel protein [Flavobacterium sp. GA093]|uniref:Outer membrane beta-barrel protein n=1 Tax=Flavobacterium hydrocarbonoxydans TaxID=2683249 RepID=A0A6I4NUH2_9FLAO|nr:porin family protein [Flavobacterium hydrocarbonoxydans]MWB94674.1 outer membrane beta-barrel protein [Flavobacterium hydrocarbonoxydans]
MKKIIMTAAAVLAFAYTNAQEVKFGVKAGLNIANQTGDVVGTESLVGFHVGGFAEIKLTDKFSIQPELLYSAQGAKYDFSEPEFDSFEEGKLKLAYLNIPVMAKFYVTEKFTVEAGPQIGFLLSAKDDYSGSFMGESYSENEDVKDGYKSIDFGVNFGAGYDFTENLSVGLRYNLGLSNIVETEDAEEFDVDDVSVQNSVFSLSVGYKF